MVRIVSTSGGLSEEETVAALEQAATVTPTGAWDFTTAPTVGGAPIAGDYATTTALSAGLATKQDAATLGADVAADPAVRGAFARNVMAYDGNLAAARPDIDGPVVWLWPEDPANADDTQDHWVPVSLDGTGPGEAISYTDEQVRDVIGTTIQVGAGLTKTVDDVGDTVTITATASGASVAAAVMGHYEPGRFLSFPGAVAGTAVTLATASRPSATWIPVWEDTAVDQIGIEITTAGGVGTTVGLALYKKRATEGVLDLVLSTTAVDATTIGFKETTIAQTLTAGRYLALVTEKANPGGTMPTVRALTGRGPFEGLTRAQMVDPRGGVPFQAFGSPQVTADWPATLTLTDAGGNIAHSPAIYLRTA